jgi:hypothetical protein
MSYNDFITHKYLMNHTEYKKYSLSKLEEWIHDAMSFAEATPQEIYDVIVSVVKENYYTYKYQTSQAYELLALLNGNGKDHLSCDKDDPSPECKKSWTSFWGEKEDKVVKWQLPVEMDPSGECYVLFPDDLLEAANLKEGDKVEWNDNGDGSYTLVKVSD